MTRPQALLFDFGGVLVQIHWERAFQAWSAAAGVAPGEVARRFRYDEAFRAHERGAMSDAEFFSALRASLGLPIPDADLLAGWNAIFGEPVPGVAARVRELSARLPVYVFSNTNVAHLAHWKPRYRELLSPAREVFCSCELGHRKPDAEAFRRVVGRIGVPPGAIAFFDDLEENVAGARAAGLEAFHVPRPADLHATLERLMP